MAATMVQFPLDGAMRQLPLVEFKKAMTAAEHMSRSPTHPHYNAKSLPSNERRMLRAALRALRP